MNYPSVQSGADVSLRRFAVVALLMAGPWGCSRPAPVPSPVEGTVTFLGRPLSGGLVVFTPDIERGSAGWPVVADVSSDGRYALASLPPGWYRVSLSDPPTGNAADGFPAELRRPDRSGLCRQILPGRAHRIDFHIDAAVSR
jgi:hypothetical protein